MIIGTSHGWAKSDVNLFWPDYYGGVAIVEGAGFPSETAIGFEADRDALRGPRFAPLVLAGAMSVSHFETGFSLCSAEIAASNSPVSLFCRQSLKLYLDEKSATPGFENNSFIFRPPIRLS